MKRSHPSLPRLASLSYLLALVALPALPACGDDGRGGGGASGGGSDDLTFDEAQTQVAEHSCDYLVRCGLIADQAACLAVVPENAQIAADVESGKVIFHPANVAACLAALDSFGCSQSAFSSSDKAALESACAGYVTGTVADGGDCFSAAECENRQCDSSACTGAEMCCPGKCTSPIALGADCLDTDIACAGTAFCKPDATGMGATCSAPGTAAEGAACTAPQDCASSTCVAGKCDKSLPKLGELCSGSLLSLCDNSTLEQCSPTTMKCEKRLAVGADCKTGTFEPISGPCVFYARCLDNKCTETLKAGEACSSDPMPGTDNDCDLGLKCASGKCAKNPAEMVCGAAS